MRLPQTLNVVVRNLLSERMNFRLTATPITKKDTTMKKCTYCGKENPEEATVCERDGQPLIDPNAASQEKTNNMSFWTMLFGGSKTLTVHEKVRQVLELRTREGWDGTYLKGELTAIMYLLEKEGARPEDIAKITFHEDWLGFVAKFAG